MTGEAPAVVAAAGTLYTRAMQWTKAAGDQWICRVPPGARFTLKVIPRSDRRWSWEVFSGDADSPMATGIANSLGAAKNVAEQFVKRAGYG